jgi:hypothetical protein
VIRIQSYHGKYSWEKYRLLAVVFSQRDGIIPWGLSVERGVWEGPLRRRVPNEEGDSMNRAQPKAKKGYLQRLCSLALSSLML